MGTPPAEVNKLVDENVTPSISQSMIDKVYRLAGLEGDKSQKYLKIFKDCRKRD